MKESKSYFTCAACRYTFVSDGEVERCPDCGKTKIRVSTVQEVSDYLRVRREIELEDHKERQNNVG